MELLSKWSEDTEDLERRKFSQKGTTHAGSGFRKIQ